MSHDEAARRRPDLQGILRLISLALAVTAVVKELRTPADQRAWNGKVVGFVPYEFRMPTVERFKERVWDPDAEHLIGPKVFGVGWTVNMGKAFGLLRSRLSSDG